MSHIILFWNTMKEYNFFIDSDYNELKNVIIIMIMPYDPFGLKRMVFTVKNMCAEVPEMTIRYLRLMEELNRSKEEGKKYTIIIHAN